MDCWRSSGRLLVLASTLVLQGCYTHTLIPVDQVTPGSSVQARISATQADRLVPILGREARLLTGEVVGVEPESVMLEVPTASDPGRRLAQRVTVPRSEVLEMELRELDRVRTFGVIAGVAVLGGVLAYTQFGGSAGTRSTPKPGGEQSRLGIGFGFGWEF